MAVQPPASFFRRSEQSNGATSVQPQLGYKALHNVGLYLDVLPNSSFGTMDMTTTAFIHSKKCEEHTQRSERVYQDSPTRKYRIHGQ